MRRERVHRTQVQAPEELLASTGRRCRSLGVTEAVADRVVRSGAAPHLPGGSGGGGAGCGGRGGEAGIGGTAHVRRELGEEQASGAGERGIVRHGGVHEDAGSGGGRVDGAAHERVGGQRHDGRGGTGHDFVRGRGHLAVGRGLLVDLDAGGVVLRGRRGGERGERASERHDEHGSGEAVAPSAVQMHLHRSLPPFASALLSRGTGSNTALKYIIFLHE